MNGPTDWLTTQLDEHIATAEQARAVLPELAAVAELLCSTFADRGILYTCGNGGSAADAQHLTGEIVGHFVRHRRPLAAVTLSTDPTTISGIANDYGYEQVFSRQIEALAREGDAVAVFSTSGDSPNVIAALSAARKAGAATVLFGGRDGGRARALADHALIVPAVSTARIQEVHTFFLHAISERVDAWAAATEGHE